MEKMEQKAFEALKEYLMTPSVLKQADGTKPFILRIDASYYGLWVSFYKEMKKIWAPYWDC